MEHKIEKKSFDDVKKVLFSEFEKSKIDMVLSTSLNDDVSSRTVSLVKLGDNFYFLTHRHSRKYPQILKNNRVSLCRESLIFKAVAKDLGSVRDDNNKKVADAIEATYSSNEEYQMFAGADDAIFIELSMVSGEVIDPTHKGLAVLSADFIKKEAIKIIFC